MGQQFLLCKIPPIDEITAMPSTGIRQFLVAMAESVLKGFDHGDHRQLLWDLNALETGRPGQEGMAHRRQAGYEAFRMKEPTVLQGVFAEVISSMGLTTLELMGKKKAIVFCIQWEIEDASLWSLLPQPWATQVETISREGGPWVPRLSRGTLGTPAREYEEMEPHALLSFTDCKGHAPIILSILFFLV